MEAASPPYSISSKCFTEVCVEMVQNVSPYSVFFNDTQLFVSPKNLQYSFSLQSLKQTQIHVETTVSDHLSLVLSVSASLTLCFFFLLLSPPPLFFNPPPLLAPGSDLLLSPQELLKE